MALDDRARQRAGVVVRDGGQLQQQALLDAARAHAGGFERLHPRERDLQFLLVRRRRQVRDPEQLGQREAQIAVVVQRADDGLGDRRVARGQREDVQLAQQVVAERILDGVHFEEIDAVVVVAAGDRRAVGMPRLLDRRRVDAGAVVPGGAFRQDVGLRRGGEFRLRLVGERHFGDGCRFLADDRLAGVFIRFEEGIPAEHLVDFLGEIQRGQLQQAHGTLQPGGKPLLLPLPGALDE